VKADLLKKKIDCLPIQHFNFRQNFKSKNANQHPGLKMIAIKLKGQETKGGTQQSNRSACRLLVA